MPARRRLHMGWLVLYLTTAALELPVLLARYLATFVMAAILLKATGHPSAGAAAWAKLALLPTLWSAAALVTPAGSGWWWQQRMGGREPSKREYLLYRDATDRLQAATTILLPTPKRWFVLDEPEPDAAVCGDTLMLSSGLLASPHLTAVLAHQLGHLQNIDARLTAAVNRLVIDHPKHGSKTDLEDEMGGASIPRPSQTQPVVGLRRATLKWRLASVMTRMTIALLRGGLALRLTAPAWGQVWREAEYEADRWAAHIGLADELADFLEGESLKHDHPIPLVWLTDHTHPPTELRIERLRAAANKQRPTPAPDVEVLEIKG
jgi:Zn-dependent protease with chaperone function